jgi:hypothetical protein
MARYRILIPDPLLSVPGGLQWPPGCSLVERGEPGSAGTHWWLFDDPDAPAGFDGQRVALTLERGRKSEDEPEGDGTPRIAARHLIVTHLAPVDESGEMPCCGVPAWEMHRSDSVTGDAGAVTCGGAP